MKIAGRSMEPATHGDVARASINLDGVIFYLGHTIVDPKAPVHLGGGDSLLPAVVSVQVLPCGRRFHVLGMFSHS